MITYMKENASIPMELDPCLKNDCEQKMNSIRKGTGTGGYEKWKMYKRSLRF